MIQHLNANILVHFLLRGKVRVLSIERPVAVIVLERVLLFRMLLVLDRCNARNYATVYERSERTGRLITHRDDTLALLGKLALVEWPTTNGDLDGGHRSVAMLLRCMLCLDYEGLIACWEGLCQKDKLC